MTRLNQSPTTTARHLMIALSEVFPDSTYGAVPVANRADALEAYFECANGAPAANTEITFPLVTAVAK